MRPQPNSRRSQRGNTLMLVLIAMTLLLISAVVILRSSGVSMLVAGNVVSRTAGNQAAEVAAFADGVIVGSAFVRRLLDSPDVSGVAAVRDLAAELAAGVRRR